jgi:hypothetical protein
MFFVIEHVRIGSIIFYSQMGGISNNQDDVVLPEAYWERFLVNY